MRWKNVKRLLVAAAAGFIAVCVCLAVYSEYMNKRLSDSMIRLHVVAASDSEADQAAKLAVRDAVLAWMDERAGAGAFASRDEADTFIRANSEGIRAAAEEALMLSAAGGEVADAGAADTVAVNAGMMEFPTKTYGGIVLPAGRYYALRVTLGAGAGANWWCVLFPPLCFSDLPGSTGRVSSELSGEGDGELGRLTDNSAAKPVEYKIKFKIVEIFQNIRQKLAGQRRAQPAG